MNRRKLKVLILGQDDTTFSGHALWMQDELPDDKFDKKLVVLEKRYNGGDYVYFYDYRNRFKRAFMTRVRIFMEKIKIRRFCGEWLRLRPDPQGHAFHVSAFNSITGDDILNKCSGFIPDLIVMMWTRKLVSAEAVKRMYELTHARFLFVFVDEAHLTGGCHYPVDCDGYLHGCYNCPALVSGKQIAAMVMADKLRCFKDIPKYVLGVSADCRLARQSPLFKDAKFYPLYSYPKVDITDKDEARRHFGIPKNAFVAMVGSHFIYDVRKGVHYGMEAINKLSEKYDNIYAFILGRNQKDVKIYLNYKIHTVMPGFLNLQGLFKAYCASDCFLNMTIADSGPMMVNYSIALGTPVISFNIGVAQDLVIHKKTGYIAELKNSEDVARGMEFIHNLSVEERIKMSEECRAHIAKVESVLPWYEQIYENWEEDYRF